MPEELKQTTEREGRNMSMINDITPACTRLAAVAAATGVLATPPGLIMTGIGIVIAAVHDCMSDPAKSWDGDVLSFENSTGKDVVGVYFYNFDILLKHSLLFSNNKLSGSVLERGKSRNISLPRLGCNYRVRIEFKDGSECVVDDVHVGCAAKRLVLKREWHLFWPKYNVSCENAA